MSNYDPPRGGYPTGAYSDQAYQQPPGPPPGYPMPPADPRQARAAAAAERARTKAMRPWYAKKRWWILGGLVLLVAIAAVASAGGDEDTGGGGDDPAAAVEGGQDVYAVGQTAHTGDFDVTVHALEDPFAVNNQFEVPPEGHRFVGVEATVTNTGGEPLPFSTLMGVELFDQLDRPWQIALAGTDRPQLDAPTVAPGESRRGWVVFSVPPDATELTLRVKGNLTATGSLFSLSG
jgi:Domain of unknown function (DUF4352)